MLMCCIGTVSVRNSDNCFCGVGKNGAGQPLTDEQRQAYTNNHAAVMRHYKQLQLQYNVLRTGMVRKPLLHPVQHHLLLAHVQQS